MRSSLFLDTQSSIDSLRSCVRRPVSSGLQIQRVGGHDGGGVRGVHYGDGVDDLLRANPVIAATMKDHLELLLIGINKDTLNV